MTNCDICDTIFLTYNIHFNTEEKMQNPTPLQDSRWTFSYSELGCWLSIVVLIGDLRYNLRCGLKKFLSEANGLHGKIYRQIEQGRELLELHNGQLSARQQEFLDSLTRFEKMNKIAKWSFMLKYDMLKEGLLRNIVTFLFIWHSLLFLLMSMIVFSPKPRH